MVTENESSLLLSDIWCDEFEEKSEKKRMNEIGFKKCCYCGFSVQYLEHHKVRCNKERLKSIMISQCEKAVETIIKKISKNEDINSLWHAIAMSHFKNTNQHGIMVLRYRNLTEVAQDSEKSDDYIKKLAVAAMYFTEKAILEKEALKNYLPNKRFLVCIEVHLTETILVNPVCGIDGIKACADKTNIFKTVLKPEKPVLAKTKDDKEGLRGRDFRLKYVANLKEKINVGGIKLDKDLTENILKYLKDNVPFRTVLTSEKYIVEVDCRRTPPE